MPSGAVTLLEAVKWGSDVRKKGVVDIIINESPILEHAPVFPFQGNAIESTLEDTLPTVAFRDVNEGYTADHGTDEKHYWGVAILGGEVKVDNFIVRTMGDLGDVKARQYAKKAKSAALTFDKNFFDGTGSSKDFKGVNTLITDGFGTSKAVGTNGLQVVASAPNMITFLDKLDEVADDLRTGPADAAITNRTVRRLITKAAREALSSAPMIDVGTSKLGKKVTTYDDVPLLMEGEDATGSLILDFDETVGSSTDCASIYFVRWGVDEGVSVILGGGGFFEVVDFGESEAKPEHLGRIEFYPGLMVASKYSVVRVTGIRK